MSLYADYVKERLGDEIIETPEGFCTYRYLNETQVYIVDIYVVPEMRKLRHASAIADMVVAEALKKGCKELLGTVVPTAKNSTASLKVLLGYGMKLQSCSNDLIVLKKEF